MSYRKAGIARIGQQATRGDVKAQPIRVLDVFVIGPMMVAGGLAIKDAPVLRAGLIAAGIGTIAYNARNYAEVERRLSESR